MSGWPWYHHVFNVLIWLVWNMPYFFLLERRLPLWKTILLAALWFVPYYSIVMLLTEAYSLTRFVIGQVISFCVPLVLFRGKFGVKVLSWFLVVIIELVSDILSAKLVLENASPSPTNSPLSGYVLSLLINGALLAMLSLAGLAIRKRSSMKLRFSEILMLSVFPISQLFLLLYLLTHLWNDFARYSTFRMGLIFPLFLASDACLMLLIRSVSQSSALSTEVQLLEEERVSQDKYYASLADDYQNAVAMRAALLSERDRFTALLEAGRPDDALKCVEDLKKSQLTSALPQCENRVVGSFLERRLQALKDSGVSTAFSVVLPAVIGVSDPDLICLFGNLLDNAAEACADVAHAEVSLTVDYHVPYLRVRMENSVSDAPEAPRRKRVPELERGLGFHIIDSLAEKYDGEFYTDRKNGRFLSSVTLKGETEDASYLRL